MKATIIIDMAKDDSQPGANGQPVNWAAELERHGRWLRTVIFARLGDSQAVDDVWQEVSLAAIEGRAPLVHAEKASAWLYRVTVRQALLYLRKHRRGERRFVPYDREASQFEEHGERDPLGWLLANERGELVRNALNQLKPRDRELLLLKYTEDFSYRELAGHLGLSEAAVESRLHRARQRLRQHLVRLNVIEEPP